MEADGLQRALAPVTAAAVGASSTAAAAVPAATAPPAALDAGSGGGGDETWPAVCTEGCPVDPLRESVASMEALLREWFEGLGGSPSVRELEEPFEGRWRYTPLFASGSTSGGTGSWGGKACFV